MPFQIVLLANEDPWATTTGGTLRVRALIDGLAVSGAEVRLIHRPASPGLPTTSGGRIPAQRGLVRDVGLLRRVKRELLPVPTLTGGRNRSVTRRVTDLARTADLVISCSLRNVRYFDMFHHALTWIDYSDLWSEFAAREAVHRTGARRVSASLQSRHFRRIENECNGRADLITAAGFSDYQCLLARGVTAAWLPTPVACVGEPVPRTRTTARPTAGFIGNFAFHPNRDALQVLLQNWAPRLVRAGWRVAVAGRLSESLSLPPWVERFGPVTDIAEFYDRIDLALAPIRLGGGMKVKVVEALLHGRPVVASEFAMAGFPPDLRELVHVVDIDHPELPLPSDVNPFWSCDHPALFPFTSCSFRRQVASHLAEVSQ